MYYTALHTTGILHYITYINTVQYSKFMKYDYWLELRLLVEKSKKSKINMRYVAGLHIQRREFAVFLWEPREERSPLVGLEAPELAVHWPVVERRGSTEDNIIQYCIKLMQCKKSYSFTVLQSTLLALVPDAALFEIAAHRVRHAEVDVRATSDKELDPTSDTHQRLSVEVQKWEAVYRQLSRAHTIAQLNIAGELTACAKVYALIVRSSIEHWAETQESQSSSTSE